MKHKLKDSIKDFSFEELKFLENDLKNGEEIIKYALWERMQEISNSEKFCATCFRELKSIKYSVTLGTKFRKKVSFCEIDCMQYFISHLKDFEKEVECKRGEDADNN
ncbi:hypothetical protein KY308_01225 [Candidatus Woesearchaeota archaeon]|nr:hypothetical protein [Candidatus Woesearchaeota archaeon]